MENKKNIIQSPEVRVVEASAGSGKTYALAKRYLKLALNKKYSLQIIRGILAVTFTNPAAREMKEIILDFLKKIALDRFPDKNQAEDIFSFLEIDRDTACKKAEDLMDYIVRNYSFFQVQTIDSFINILLSGCSYKLGISARFKIKENYKDFLSYSLDECIQKANEDKKIKNIFDNFIKQYLILENKSSWFPKNDILKILNSLFNDSLARGMNFLKSDLSSKNLLSMKKHILELMFDLKEKLPEGTNKKFSKNLINFLDKNKNQFDFQKLSSFFKKEDFPLNKGYSATSDIDNLWDNIKQELSGTASKEALSLFNCYIDIFYEVNAFFKKASAGKDVMFLAELNKEARRLFENSSITVPELYYRLAERFRHYLIDEFQDTSILQWLNLNLMIEEALSSGGSLFYVGDKKQAIYRFRGGEVSLFDSVKNNLSSFNVRPEFLTINYRSQQSIVEFNNSLFSESNLRNFIKKCMEEKKDNFRFLENKENVIIDSFKNACQEIFKKNQQKGYVKTDLIKSEDKETQESLIKEMFLAKINLLKQRFLPSDIWVLVRKNSQVELVSGWLAEDNIAVESDKTLNVKNNKFIKEIISFLKFLNSPVDGLSFASFILGDIFLKASGIAKKEIENFLVQRAARGKNNTDLSIYREFREKYSDVWNEYIEDYFKNVGLIGFYELLVGIYGKFQIFENFKGYWGFFMHLAEMVKIKEEDYQNLDEFLEYFETAQKTDKHFYIKSSVKNAVKVKTVHKAKGLSLPVVILPFMELKKKHIVPSAPGNVSYIVREIEGQLALLRIDKKYAGFSEFVNEIYQEECMKSLIDELNIIYVALTRAKYEMHIFLPDKNNLLKFFIPENMFELGSFYKKETCETEEISVEEISAPKYADWINYLKDEFFSLTAVKNREEILKGNVIHYILSMIGNLKDLSVVQVLKSAIESAKIKFPEFKDFSNTEVLLKNFLNNNFVKKFFYIDNADIFNEKEIVHKEGITKRIDRLIINKNKKQIWIIDYKLSQINEEDYNDQIKEYIFLIRQMYPDFKVTGYIIFIKELNITKVNI